MISLSFTTFNSSSQILIIQLPPVNERITQIDERKPKIFFHLLEKWMIFLLIHNFQSQISCWKLFNLRQSNYRKRHFSVEKFLALITVWKMNDPPSRSQILSIPPNFNYPKTWAIRRIVQSQEWIILGAHNFRSFVQIQIPCCKLFNLLSVQRRREKLSKKKGGGGRGNGVEIINLEQKGRMILISVVAGNLESAIYFTAWLEVSRRAAAAAAGTGFFYARRAAAVAPAENSRSNGACRVTRRTDTSARTRLNAIT